MNKEYDVIVVGGGLAGLTSAAYLSSMDTTPCSVNSRIKREVW